MDHHRLAKAKDDAEAAGLHPLLRDRCHRQRSVFSPGHRIRMNILPMFLNLFVPWGIFLFVLGISSFWMMYSKPVLGCTLIGIVIIFWIVTAVVAMNRRKYDPDPTWYTFFSLMVGVAIFSGVLLGSNIFNTHTKPYYEINDLKLIDKLDAAKEHGQNVMDAGVFYFAPGNKLDPLRSWHFKQKTKYCVAPITGNGIPETQRFDYWAVGKDCCSTSTSDFRCGAYNNPLARGGVRVLNDKDIPFYRLAVEQAESLYGIMTSHPVFFEWALDPLETVNSWNRAAFDEYARAVAFGFVISLFAVSMFSVRTAWLGRAESVYGEEFFSDPEWKKGGYITHKDLHTHARTV